MLIFRVFCFESCDDPPQEDHEQRAEEGGDEILESDLQLPEPEVDSEQLEQLAANRRANHAHQEVHPPAQALLFESDGAPRERSCEAADNNPHDDLANVHKFAFNSANRPAPPLRPVDAMGVVRLLGKQQPDK